MCDYCSWINKVFDKIGADVEIKKKKKVWADPVIIVHGGAGNIPQYMRKFMLNEVKKAAIMAYRDMIKGCCSLDAVERAICHMERKKYFNCAYGGSLDANGEVVMDAAIMMDNFRAGCVGAVRNIAHPITLAKKVLQTEHVLIVESGAQKLAMESNIPILSSEKLRVTNSQISLNEEEDNEEQETSRKNERNDMEVCVDATCMVQKYEDEKDISETLFIESDECFEEIESDLTQIGAVGAVAFDRYRRLASGTSTAGESGKLHGSVSATGTVIGCGIYVDQGSSISVSGCDDIIHRYAPALQISRRLRRLTCTLIDEATAILKDVEKKTGTCDMGAIVLTDKGIPLVSYRCAHFPWAYCEKGHVHYGCMKNEQFSERIRRKEFM